MDRFSAYLLVRRFLRRPAGRNRALVVEAIMQELAARIGEAGEPWGVLGLLSQLDLEYAERNPRARGVTARQQAELEGLAPEQAAHLERWRTASAAAVTHGARDAIPAAPVAAVEDALCVASTLGDLALGRGGPPEPELEASRPRPRPLPLPLDDDLARRLARELQLRRQQGDSEGDRLDEALARLRLDADEAGRLALAGLRRAGEDRR